MRTQKANATATAHSVAGGSREGVGNEGAARLVQVSRGYYVCWLCSTAKGNLIAN